MFLGGEIFKDNRLAPKAPIKTKIFAGVIGGVMGIILMVFSVNIHSNIVLDLRQFAIIVLAFHGGIVSSVITGIMMAAFRIVFFGLNSASITVALLIMTLSIFCGVIGDSGIKEKNKWILMNLGWIITVNLVLYNSLTDMYTTKITMIYFTLISVGVAFLVYYLSKHIVLSNILFTKYKVESKITDNLTDLVTVHKVDGTYIYLSPSCKKILGYRPEELMETNPYDLFYRQDLETISKSHSVITNTNKSDSVIYRIKRKDGKIIWFETTSKALKDKEGKVEQLICVSRDISERKSNEVKLQNSHEKVNDILESIKDAFFALDKNFCFEYLNVQSEIILERSRVYLIGKNIWEVFPEAVNTSFYKNYNKAMHKRTQINFEEFYAPMNKYFSVRVYPTEDGISVFYHDITAKKAMENKLIRSENRFRSLVNSMNDIVYTLDTDQKHTAIYGKWIDNENLQIQDFIGKKSRDIFGEEASKVHEKANMKALNGETVVYDWGTESNGEIKYYQTSVSPIRSSQDDIIGIVGVGRDITNQKELEKELMEANTNLKNMSLIDGLTNIPNRRSFDENFEKEWNRSLRNSTNLSLLILDIDHFKSYNDNYGHLQGDECLKLIANTLNQSINRSADIVARYGGEEFVIVLPETTAKGAMFVAEKIRNKVKNMNIPNPTSKVKPYITVSIGVASIVASSILKSEDLIRNADKALYNAKKSGRNKSELYSKNRK